MERQNSDFAAPARHNDLGAENGAASSPIAVIDSATIAPGGLELLAPLALPDGILALSLAECQKHTN